MPTIYWEGSYQELEGRMRQLDTTHHVWWWHVTQRYWFGKIHRGVVRYRRTAKGPIPEMPPRSELLIQIETLPGNLMAVQYYRWSESVNPRFVEMGLDQLLSTMYGGDTTRIHLPKDLLNLALGKEPEDGRVARSRRVPSATLNPQTSGG